MNAQLFSHTVDNLGFNPKHPQPPAYIKVRAKFKKEKEFNRVFLAQELRTAAEKTADQQAKDGPQPSGKAATHNPIWATEFSKDGKYLAAAGQDKVVRVWAVISSPEERTLHEHDESGSNGPATHLSAPVFHQKPFREYHGHTSTILDLSWSKNNFLLSSSMDKTVRLWHISRNDNLCTFKHTDFVPSIQFHPRDDRFFLAGSLDCKLRLWSIPDKSVAFWNQLPDMITAVSFTPDGKTCIAGTLSGLCMFYETEGLKYQTQMHVKSTRGPNAKGSKITGIQTTHWPLGNSSGDVKILVTSNDSRVRLYNMRDKSLEVKFRGHENNCSQIRATFADDSEYIICGSEDRKAYIWSTSAAEGDKRNLRPMEMFDAHSSITTCAVLAPLKTRRLLSNSEDPIFDLCNPPPVTLVSKAESVSSRQQPHDANGPARPTPTPEASTEDTFQRVAESPAYIARSAHADGNIIVTADYTGALKVFRQDCAHTKRMRAADQWETSSVFSKKVGSMAGGRPSSIMSKGTSRTRRDSTSTQPPNDRIMSWRQDISHGSFDSVNGNGNGTPKPARHEARSVSPRKSVGQLSLASSTMTRPTPIDSPALSPHDHNLSPRSKRSSGGGSEAHHSPTHNTSHHNHNPTSNPNDTTTPSTEPHHHSRHHHHTQHHPQLTPQLSNFDPAKSPENPSDPTNPLSIYNGQSWAFWSTNGWRERMKERTVADDERVPHHAPSPSKPNDPNDHSLGNANGNGHGHGNGNASTLAPPRPDAPARGESVVSTVSALSDELLDGGAGAADGAEVRCRACGGVEWRVRSVRVGGGHEEKRVVCARCGRGAEG